MQSNLLAAVAEYIENNGGPDAVSQTPMSNVFAICSTQRRLPFRKIYKPSLCIVLQGAKRIELSDEIINYGAGTALAVSIEVPGFGGIVEASSEEPFIGMTIDFDIDLLRNVLENMEAPPPTTRETLGAFVEQLSEPLQDCLLRLVRLFPQPEAVPILYPGVMRELYYLLLTGPNGGEIAKIVQTDSHTRRIADAIYLLRKDYARPIRVEEMAEVARMSPSSFHQHFKTLTSMTPLQYHKQLRLIEARRLMVIESANVTKAAFHVGYESTSQFSREYTRLFGTPPKRDAMALRPFAQITRAFQ